MIDKSTSAALDRIFDEMYNLISAASRIPLTDKNHCGRKAIWLKFLMI